MDDGERVVVRNESTNDSSSSISDSAIDDRSYPISRLEIEIEDRSYR